MVRLTLNPWFLQNISTVFLQYISIVVHLLQYAVTCVDECGVIACRLLNSGGHIVLTDFGLSEVRPLTQPSPSACNQSQTHTIIVRPGWRRQRGRQRGRRIRRLESVTIFAKIVVERVTTLRVNIYIQLGVARHRYSENATVVERCIAFAGSSSGLLFVESVFWFC
jgi:hypothetical protein